MEEERNNMREIEKKANEQCTDKECKRIRKG
jgi:hypothetical protein